MKYSNHQTKYIGKLVGLRIYQHSCTNENKEITSKGTYRIIISTTAVVTPVLTTVTN